MYNACSAAVSPPLPHPPTPPLSSYLQHTLEVLLKCSHVPVHLLQLDGVTLCYDIDLVTVELPDLNCLLQSFTTLTYQLWVREEGREERREGGREGGREGMKEGGKGEGEGRSKYSETSLKGLSELRTQYKKPPY